MMAFPLFVSSDIGTRKTVTRILFILSGMKCGRQESVPEIHVNFQESRSTITP